MTRLKALSTLALVLGLCLSVMGANAKTPTIKKCKDVTGQWHYGDTAAEECAQSKVVVITEQGTTKRVIDAPPTEQELKQREKLEEAEQAKQKQSAEQARKDTLLLSTYGSEDDITYIRDRKIAQIETTIKSSEETLKSLRAALARMEAQAADEAKGGKDSDEKATAKNIEQTKNQIGRHEAQITEKRQEQDALRKQYADELARYREIKKQQAAKTVSEKK
jgi:hypothetical protein